MCALKVIEKKTVLQNAMHKEQFVSEVTLQRQVGDSPNIVKIQKVLHSKTCVQFLLSYKSGGTLKKFIRGKNYEMNEESLKIAMVQLLLNIHYLQLFGIVHRDLKPENILLDDTNGLFLEIFLADFGFAIKNDIKKLKAICGTPGYMAPENLGRAKPSLKTDIFSAGAIMYYMMTKKHLFNGETEQEILQKNKGCELDLDEFSLSSYSS